MLSLDQLLRKLSYQFCNRLECDSLNASKDKWYDAEKIVADKMLTPITKKEILDLKLSISNGPSSVVDYLNMGCYNKCIFCRGGHRTFADANQKIIDRCDDWYIKNIDVIKEIGFCGGEPLIKKRVVNIIKEYMGSGTKFYVTSNLNYLSTELKESFEGTDFSKFRCSVNAASLSTYQKISPGGDWFNVVNNLEYMISLRDRRKCYFPIIISMVVNKINYHEILDFVKFGIEKGVDKIVLYSLFPNSANDIELGVAETKEVIEMLKSDTIMMHESSVTCGPLLKTCSERLEKAQIGARFVHE